MTSFSVEDSNRLGMYQDDIKRNKLKAAFKDYDEYLRSLEMKAEIQRFIPAYMSRIAQLTNKSNQFNLTTKRYSQSEIEEIAASSDYITLYGRLSDKFGDNGVVSVVIGRIGGEQKDVLHIELWLMSCRVLKRNMEYAMMDVLMEQAQKAGIKKIMGYYYPTAKNGMVKDFYAMQGFTKIHEDMSGNTLWEYIIQGDYQKKQSVIEIIEVR